MDFTCEAHGYVQDEPNAGAVAAAMQRAVGAGAASGTLGTLLGLSRRVEVVDGSMTTGAVIEMLERTGVQVAEVRRGDGRVETLTLGSARRAMAKPFGRALYYDREVSLFLDKWRSETPVFVESSLIADACRAGLERAAEARQEPILVRRSDGAAAVVAFHLVLVAQSEVLREAMEEAKRQREAAEESNRAREAIQQELLEASRKAGKAEMAIGVLHNVGNVANSLVVSLSMMKEWLATSKVGGLGKAVGLINENRADLAGFFGSARGAQLADYLEKLNGSMNDEVGRLSGEVSRVASSVEHLQSIITSQQRHAKSAVRMEAVTAEQLVREALRIEGMALVRHQIEVVEEHAPAPQFQSDRHLLLQVLVNLLTNAKRAIDDQNPAQRRIVIRSGSRVDGDGTRVQIIVEDTGVGIEKENLPKLFTHGFTTRKSGHGFGLHSAATVVQQLGGQIEARSEGVGRGATFVVTLPLASAAAPGEAAAA